MSTSAGLGDTLLPPIGTMLIDSVPPAMTTSAKPHMMRSARVRDGLQARRAEAVDGDRAGLDRHAGAQARDPRDVEALLAFRHRAAQDHVVDLLGVEARARA